MTEAVFFPSPGDDWDFSGRIKVGWKLFLAEENKNIVRVRCVWGTKKYVRVCGMRPQMRPLDGKGLDSHTQENRPSCLLGRYIYR